MARSTVSLVRWVPALYRLRDATGDWGRVLAICERVLNDLLSAPETRAFLDCGTVGAGHFDTVLEAASEGDSTRDLRVSLEETSSFGAPFSPSERRVRLFFAAGVTTVGDIEDGLAALPEEQRAVRVRTSGTRSRVLQVGDAFGPTRLVGPSPGGRVLGKVSIDAMADLWDPLEAEARILPYLAQKVGWDLDTSLPERLQRKVVALVESLFREKGTRAGIVDALRLLLGIEVTYEEAWADGWRLGEDALDATTDLAPAERAPGHAEGMLVAVPAASLVDGDTIDFPNGQGFVVQKSAPFLGLQSRGWLHAPHPGLVTSGETLTLPKSTGGVRTYAFHRSDVDLPVGSVGVDIGWTANGHDVATALADAINAEWFGGRGTQSASVVDDMVLLYEETTPGAGGNVALAGSALDLFDAIGMRGGAPSGGFVTPPGYTALCLIGAVTAEDVAKLLVYHLRAYSSLEATRSLLKVYLRDPAIGPDGDGAISGAAAAALSATGMTGGDGLNPSVLTFRITFPRHLTDQELRTAIAVVDGMKRAETHWVYINPPAVEYPRWRLNRTALGRERLASGALVGYEPLTGATLADPCGGKSLDTYRVELSSPPLRSVQLPVGGRFLLMADDDCYIRQGNRTVSATVGDRFLAGGDEIEIVVESTRDAYVSALSTAITSGLYLRITRADG